MPYSTGVVTNTKDFGSVASKILVSTTNVDLSYPVVVIVKIFASVDSSLWYTAYISTFPVAPNSFDVREFFIEGNVAYEVQINVLTGSTDAKQALVSVYAINEFGKLITNQGFTMNNQSFIPQYTHENNFISQSKFEHSYSQ